MSENSHPNLKVPLLYNFDQTVLKKMTNQATTKTRHYWDYLMYYGYISISSSGSIDFSDLTYAMAFDKRVALFCLT